MQKQIIINVGPPETRIAKVEDGKLTEIFIERPTERSVVGNIYLGKVIRVLPGIQAAFIDIGAARAAFLYAGDVTMPEEPKVLADESLDEPESSKERHRRPVPPIDTLLKEGERIVVQVVKDPIGTKGARVTTHLSLPGRYTVLVPFATSVGVSRRIPDSTERERLRILVRSMLPSGCGAIVRTAGDGVDESLLRQDLASLQSIWQSVEQRLRRSVPPKVVYQEEAPILRITRDALGADVSDIIVDDDDTFSDLRGYLEEHAPDSTAKLKRYHGTSLIFDEYGIEVDIARCYNERVWLRSGGYLIIQQTEALTSFDVNTGRYVGHHTAQDTILHTNLEAVDEIVDQLRLRNIGGIIVLDLIDMERIEDRDTVYERLLERLKTDKARTNVLRVSELGLVQMTRQRTRESLERAMTEPCPMCQGRGRTLKPAAESANLLREIERWHLRTGRRSLQVRVRDDVLGFLMKHDQGSLKRLTQEYRLQLDIQAMRQSNENGDQGRTLSPFEVADANGLSTTTD